MWEKEMGKWLAEDTTALWCDHSTSYILKVLLLLLLYGRIFDLHRNKASTLYYRRVTKTIIMIIVSFLVSSSHETFVKEYRLFWGGLAS